MSLIKKVMGIVDYYTGRYECFEAKGKDREACLEIRKKVFGEEFKRLKKDDHFSPALPDIFDDAALLIACRDTRSKKIIGTIRVNSAAEFKNHPDHWKEYGLKHFEGLNPKEIAVATRLIVLPEYRKTPVGLLLACKAYELALTDKKMQVGAIVCEPNLYPMYRKLGYRPLDRILSSPFGGYRLPLYMVIHDKNYLERCGSPFLKILQQTVIPTDSPGLQWHREFTKKYEPISPGFTPVPEGNQESYHSIITYGMSPTGKKQLLNHAIDIDCNVGDKVLMMGSGDQIMGFVKKGALEVRRGQQTIAVLGEGDVFGEIAFILGVTRTADVIAAMPGTKITLLSLSAVKRIKSVKDQAQAWKNLARLLAQRLLTKRND